MTDASFSRWTGPLLAALATALVHGASLGFWFNADDFFILLGVRDHGPLGIWSGRGSTFFRPLTSVSHWIDLSLFGMNAVGHHLTNVVLAMAGAFLVVVLARRVAPSAPDWAPALAGALFALMPAHAEAVEWVSCRGDLLSTDLALGAAIVALGGAGGSVWVVAGLATLAMACKESALGLPLFLLVVAGLTHDRRLRPAVVATFGVAIAMVALRGLMLGRLIGGYQTSPNPLRMLSNAPRFLTSTLSPESVQTLRFSPFRPLASLLEAVSMYHVAFAVALAGGAVVLLRTRLRLDSAPNRTLWAMLAGFFALASPALVQGGVSGFTWESTRYVYLPSASLAVFLSLALARLPRNRALTVGGAFAAAYALGDVPAVGAWQVAGEQAREVIAGLLQRPGRIVALAAPDNYRGAFVLRNGVNEALELFRPGSHPEVRILALYGSESPRDWPRITPRGVVPAPGARPFQTFDLGTGARPFGLIDLPLPPERDQARLVATAESVVIYPDRIERIP